MQLQVAKFCIVRKTKLRAKLSYKKRKLLQTLNCVSLALYSFKGRGSSNCNIKYENGGTLLICQAKSTKKSQAMCIMKSEEVHLLGKI